MKNDYKDHDDLRLFLSLIESVSITFSPERNFSFKIIKPFDHSESKLRYTDAILTLKNIIYSDIQLVNEFYEYPEFHRSAILKEYYFYLDLGNSEKELRVICESHELTILSEPKYLEEFQGLDE